ncbi:apoptotic chromatin condensation inducer in the nucleus-like [Montipora capricornis]|uniref:apoptotic chromatin condensation inducer in the nucleus-like n=1 Tax=Montipora capricornis TaxID=246305 RepID=UPI0035F207C2
MAEREIMLRGRRLSQLKVEELKQELESRGLKKSGNKGVLIERLQEAIDKELEQKEGYENYSAMQQQQSLASPWPNPMVQQQQQKQNLGDFHVQSMHFEPLQHQPQELLNPQMGVCDQQREMMNQPQHLVPSAQVGEFREQWPQAQISQAPVVQPQMMQPRMMLERIPLTHVSQSRRMETQAPQLQDSDRLYSNPRSQTPGGTSLAQPLSHGVAQLTAEPEVPSSSSSDNEQDSVQQSSSSSSPDTDNHIQEKPTSLLNYNNHTPGEKRESVSTLVKDEKGSETGRSEEEGKVEVAQVAASARNASTPLANDVPMTDTPQGTESTEPFSIGSTSVKEETATAREEQEEGEIAEGDEKAEEKPSDATNEKENEPPEEKEVVSEPSKKQQFSSSRENSFEVEPSEEDKAVVEEPKRSSPQKSTSSLSVSKKRKISIPRTSLPSTPTSDGHPGSRKRRWGSSSSSKKKTSLSISTDSLKDLIPGVQVHSTPALEAVMDIGGDDHDDEEDEEMPQGKKKEEEKEPEPIKKPETKQPESKRRKDRIVKVEEKKTVKLQRKPIVIEKDHEPVQMELEEEPQVQITDNPHPRHTSLQQQETSPTEATADNPPSPARFPESEALHVKNLVRPFTLNQLKDLLGKSGPIAEDGFWIDKIKSHCYVVYTNVKDAAASRQSLHGIKWPMTSPKILAVDFADEDEMARDTEGLLGKAKEKEPEVKTEKPAKTEDQTVETAHADVAEEEDDQKNAGNLLDNLFRKTKTTPCLYWLPLSDEQIATREREREERRKARQEERKKEEETEEKERLERQQQREKEREKEKRERDTEKQRGSRSPARNRRRERSGSRSRSSPRSAARRR